MFERLTPSFRRRSKKPYEAQEVAEPCAEPQFDFGNPAEGPDGQALPAINLWNDRLSVKLLASILALILVSVVIVYIGYQLVFGANTISVHSDSLISSPATSTDDIPSVRHGPTAGEQYARPMAPKPEKHDFMNDLRVYNYMLGMDYSNHNYEVTLASLDHFIDRSDHDGNIIISRRLRERQDKLVSLKELRDNFLRTDDTVSINLAQQEYEVLNIFEQAIGASVRKKLKSMDATTLQKMHMLAVHHES